jgi:hypothetical protein
VDLHSLRQGPRHGFPWRPGRPDVRLRGGRHRRLPQQLRPLHGVSLSQLRLPSLPFLTESERCRNTSPNETLTYIELWKTTKFIEFTAQQWLALMPTQVVADLLNITMDVASKFKTEKQVIIKG